MDFAAVGASAQPAFYKAFGVTCPNVTFKKLQQGLVIARPLKR